MEWNKKHIQKKTSNIVIRSYNVQGINKSTPKTYLMFFCIRPKPLLTLIQSKYTTVNSHFLYK